MAHWAVSLPQAVGQRTDRGQPHPLVVELPGDQAPTFVLLPDQGRPGHPDTVVVGGGSGDAAHGDDRRAGEPGCRGGHQKDRDPFVLGSIGIGTDGQPDVVGLVGAAGEHLVPIDDPLVPVEDGPGAQGGQVGAGTRLGVTDGEVDLASQDPRQKVTLLLLGSVAHEHGTDRVERDEWERSPGPLDLVEEDELVGDRPPLASELLGPADPQPPVLAHTADQGSVHLSALGLGVERSPGFIGEDIGEVGPEFGPESQFFRCLFEIHGLFLFSPALSGSRASAAPRAASSLSPAVRNGFLGHVGTARTIGPRPSFGRTRAV